VQNTEKSHARFTISSKLTF